MFISRKHYFVKSNTLPSRLRSGEGGGAFDNDLHDLRLELSGVKVVQLGRIYTLHFGCASRMIHPK